MRTTEMSPAGQTRCTVHRQWPGQPLHKTRFTGRIVRCCPDAQAPIAVTIRFQRDAPAARHSGDLPPQRTRQRGQAREARPENARGKTSTWAPGVAWSLSGHCLYSSEDKTGYTGLISHFWLSPASQVHCCRTAPFPISLLLTSRNFPLCRARNAMVPSGCGTACHFWLFPPHQSH